MENPFQKIVVKIISGQEINIGFMLLWVWPLEKKLKYNFIGVPFQSRSKYESELTDLESEDSG